MNTSLNQKAIKRLKRNKAALFGLSIIVFTLFIAVFAYVIAPDNSPDGNEQYLALAMRSPLFSATFLKLPKEPKPIAHSVFSNLLNGKENEFTFIPVVSYQIKNDTFFYKEFGKTKVLFNQNKFVCLVPTIVHKIFWLGTDKLGRDILSRLLIGSRVSLSVGLVSVFISLLIGVFMGALAGYFRGWVDAIVLWVINLFWSIPTVLLAMGLYISVGNLIASKLFLIFLAVGLTMWVDVARIVRGQFLLLRELEFVTAARSMGFSSFRTVFRHILPNCSGAIIVVACANFANAILVESGLSYIGLGIQPPAPSWGSMLNEYKDFIDSDKAYLALFPGLAILFLVLAFNLLGNGLRDALDVKGKL